MIGEQLRTKGAGGAGSSKLNVNWQCALACNLLGFVKTSKANLTKDVILLYLELGQPHLEYCAQLSFPLGLSRIGS